MVIMMIMNMIMIILIIDNGVAQSSRSRFHRLRAAADVDSCLPFLEVIIIISTIIIIIITMRMMMISTTLTTEIIWIVRIALARTLMMMVTI